MTRSYTGAFLARLLATFMASLFVDASLRALELFQTVVAFQMKVLALERRGRGMLPAATDLELLEVSLMGVVGKISFPRGFRDPSGPSVL